MNRNSFALAVILCAALTLMAACSGGSRDAGPNPALWQPDPAALREWREMRFGMFIHWGPVALTGREIGWSRGRETPIEEYDQLYQKFNPNKFDADVWARTAARAGMTYIVHTSKHHDGFCLWPSKYTDYDIGETPFGRDVVKELAEACRRHGLKFGTYYSTCDWYHPDFPLGSPGGRTQKPNPNLDRYIQYLRNQVTELITNYGPLSTIWFDVPQEVGPSYGLPTLELVRRLQPDILVNNRIYRADVGQAPPDAPKHVGDYDTPEQMVGAFNRDRPWETCMTIGDQWAWKPNDRVKPLAVCLQSLIRSAAGDGNLLFNVGPKPDGEIELRQVERLREMGEWLRDYGESIYATRGGPFLPRGNLASTCRGNRIYLHLLNGLDGAVLPPIGAKIQSASVMGGGKVTLEPGTDRVKLLLDKAAVREIDTVVVLELDRSATDIPPVAVAHVKAPGQDGFYLPASMAGATAEASSEVDSRGRFVAEKVIDGDPGTQWRAAGADARHWIAIDFGQELTFPAIEIDEAWGRIRRYRLERRAGNRWVTIHEGKALGDGAVVVFRPVTTRQIRLNILESDGPPRINEIRLLRSE